MHRSSSGRRVAFLSGGAVLILLLAVGWSFRTQIRARYLLMVRFQRLAENAQGLAEYRHRKTGVIFVHLPGGTCLLGSAELGTKPREPARMDMLRISYREPRLPQQEVTLAPFLVAKYELSQEVWARFMGAQPSQFKGGDLPVASASWDDCQEFCARTGLDLPTPAQWEYACRSGTKTSFAFGNKISYDQVNYRGDRPSRHTLTRGIHRNTTLPVNSFEPNGFGLHNMHGNVWEWCRDPESSTDKWIRGGSFFRAAGFARSSVGVRAARDFAGHDVGLRPVYKLYGE
jgi:formylglycine-generating enzyme required for sulfatase activity